MDELGQVHSTASVAQLYKQAHNTDSRDESAEPKEISMSAASYKCHQAQPLSTAEDHY